MNTTNVIPKWLSAKLSHLTCNLPPHSSRNSGIGAESWGSFHGRTRQFLVAEAEAGVVVDEADGLHERIDGHWAQKLEAATLEFGGDAVGEFRPRRCRPFVGLGIVLVIERLAAREGPKPFRERAAFAPQLKEAFCVMDDGLDLPALADHSRNGQNARDVVLAIAGDLGEVESI